MVFAAGTRFYKFMTGNDLSHHHQLLRTATAGLSQPTAESLTDSDGRVVPIQLKTLFTFLAEPTYQVASSWPLPGPAGRWLITAVPLKWKPPRPLTLRCRRNTHRPPGP